MTRFQTTWAVALCSVAISSSAQSQSTGGDREPAGGAFMSSYSSPSQYGGQAGPPPSFDPGYGARQPYYTPRSVPRSHSRRRRGR